MPVYQTLLPFFPLQFSEGAWCGGSGDETREISLPPNDHCMIQLKVTWLSSSNILWEESFNSNLDHGPPKQALQFQRMYMYAHVYTVCDPTCALAMTSTVHVAVFQLTNAISRRVGMEAR